MADRPTFLIRLPDIAPEDLSLGRLAELLKHTEAAINAQVFADDPDAQPDELLTSAVGIQSGSVGLRLHTTPCTAAALCLITAAIRDAVTSEIAARALAEVEELRSLSKRIASAIEFHEGENAGILMARIAAGEPLRPARCLVSGETDIYGELVRVGGAQPKAWLKLHTGRTVPCTMNSALAREAAPLLYQVIGLHGEATWYADTWEIRSFRASELLPYRECSLIEAFASLREVAGAAWDAVEDPDAYLRDLRGDDR